MARLELQHASDYDDRTTRAVRAVLLEIGQLLGSFRGKFAVIGGAVPWLLLGDADMHHIGTVDVDLALRADALGDGEYAKLVELLLANGYCQRRGLRRFQLVRSVATRDHAPAIDVIVDFLMPRQAEIAKNNPPLVDNFAVQRADGAELALSHYRLVAIDGEMPDGGTNRVQIAVASIPALLAMKGYAIEGRRKRKDAYDIYYCVRNYPGGIQPLVKATQPLLDLAVAADAYRLIADKFRTVDDFGPTCVRQFVDGSHLLGERTADQWQRDAFGQVHAWTTELGLS